MNKLIEWVDDWLIDCLLDELTNIHLAELALTELAYALAIFLTIIAIKNNILFILIYKIIKKNLLILERKD